jgi:hypothetical protein
MTVSHAAEKTDGRAARARLGDGERKNVLIRWLDIAALDQHDRVLADSGCLMLHGESLRKCLRRAKREHWSASFVDFTLREGRWMGWLLERIAVRMRRTPVSLRGYPYFLLPRWPHFYLPYYDDRLSQRRVNLERLDAETLRFADYATDILFGLPLEKYVADLATTGEPLVYGELDHLWRVGLRADYDTRHRELPRNSRARRAAIERAAKARAAATRTSK